MKNEWNKQEAFFYEIGLSKRYNENFLSDIVRAKCISDESFLQEFFHFCFPDKPDKELKIYSIDREIYYKDNETNKGRNDFKISTSDDYYLIESKISDSNIEKCNDYIQHLKDSTHIVYIISKKTPHLKNIIRGLKGYGISEPRFWEDFIDDDEIVKTDEYKDFAIIAASILNYTSAKILPQKPALKDIEDMKKMCDKFFHDKLESKYYDKRGGNEDEWDGEEGYAYGYTIWASVWFGLIWSPSKGCFWSFAYSKEGKKELAKEKEDFSNIRPLGNYLKDGYTYYEIVCNNSSQMTKETLEKAFDEFGSIIIVIDKNGKTELKEYIKK